MRPKLDLIVKISRGLEVQVTSLEPLPCWPWRGAFANITPVVKHDGRAQSVRKLLVNHFIGDTRPGSRITPVCRNPTCVNPFHANGIGAAKPPSADLEDLIFMIDMLDEDERTLETVQQRPWSQGYSAIDITLAIQKSQAI